MRALLPDKEQKRFFDNFAREVSMSSEKTYRRKILERSFVHTNPDPTTDPPVRGKISSPQPTGGEESNGETTNTIDGSVNTVGDRE